MELTFRMQIHLKKIDVSQLHDLRDISILTFKETFEDQNTPENMQWYFENTMNIDHIQEELLNPDSSFYFAYNQNQTIGYLKLNFNNAQTENVLKNNGFEIERIYIKKEFHYLCLKQNFQVLHCQNLNNYFANLKNIFL